MAMPPSQVHLLFIRPYSKENIPSFFPVRGYCPYPGDVKNVAIYVIKDMKIMSPTKNIMISFMLITDLI